MTIAVTDTDGATTTISSTAIIADALLTPSNPQPGVTQLQPTIFPVPQFGAPAFGGAVAYFTDTAGSYGSAADFTATIDWGDGTSPSVGTIGAGPTGSPVGTYTVSGAHTYAQKGAYPIQVLIVDTGGSRLTVSNSAIVTALPLSVAGGIDPSSDSGLSTGHPNITNVVQPTFTGTVVSTILAGTTVPEAYAGRPHDHDQRRDDHHRHRHHQQSGRMEHHLNRGTCARRHLRDLGHGDRPVRRLDYDVNHRAVAARRYHRADHHRGLLRPLERPG